MGSVLAFRGGRFAALDVLDAGWFADHPGREYYVRGATPIEGRQAVCHHGMRPSYYVAVHRVGPEVFARRFVVGAVRDAGEDRARETFCKALIAGEAPRPVRDLPEFGGAA